MTEQRTIEIRFAEDPDRRGPGRLQGVLMPYETRASDRAELFEAGALHWPDNGVVLRAQHDRRQPIARFTPEVRDKQVVIDVELPDTTAGRDAATAVRAGLLTGLSVEFRAEVERMAGGVRRIARAALVGAGLVDDASYAGATVEVRERVEARRWWR